MKSTALLIFLASSVAQAMPGQIDASRSIVKWTGSKVTGSSHFGKVPVKSSKLVMVGTEVVRGGVVLDMTNFTVDDLDGKWRTKFLTHIRGKDFFDVKRFPTASLTIDSIKDGVLSGSLAIMGKSQPISFKVKKESGFYVGKAAFDRTKYGIKYGSGSFFTGLGDRVINDRVVVDFRIAVTESS
jgi:polyisoprenoid-binding protein YceI